MKLFYFLTTTLFLCAFLSAKDKIHHLSELKWKNRILLINVTLSEVKMMQLLENNAAAMKDRQLVWLIWNKHTLLTNSKQSFSEEFIQTTFTDKRFNHANPIQLIGKDGKTKLRAKHLNLNQIFQLIDSMPMRKAEMTEE